MGAAENEVVNTFGKLQPAVNAISEAKLNALRDVANKFNSTLYGAKSAIKNPNKFNYTLSNALHAIGNGANVAQQG